MSLRSIFVNPWVKHILKLSFSIGIVAYLLAAVDLGALESAFRMTSLVGILASTLLVIVGVIVFQALEIHASMKSASRIPVAELCRINLALMFYVLFLPAGLTFIIRWNKYRRAGYGGYDSAALVGFHKLLQLAVACLFAVAALMMLHQAVGRYADELFRLSVIGLIVLSVGLWLVGSGQVEGLLRRIHSRFSGTGLGDDRDGLRVSDRLLNYSKKISASFAALGEIGRRGMLAVTSFAILQHLFIVLSSWVIMDMVVPGTSLLAVTFVRSIVVILLSVPVSVGGLGVRELAFFTLFPLFGVSSESALTGSLLLFGVQLIVSTMGAIVEIGNWFRPNAVG